MILREHSDKKLQKIRLFTMPNNSHAQGIFKNFQNICNDIAELSLDKAVLSSPFTDVRLVTDVAVV